VELMEAGPVIGVYSNPARDPRFHAVTLVVTAKVSAAVRPPMNPLEILEVRAFEESELPRTLSHGMTDMLERALAGTPWWE